MSLLKTILWGKELSPEKFAQLKAKEEWENSKEYRDLQWQNKADIYTNKVIEKALEIKKNNEEGIDSTKQWKKLEKMRNNKSNFWIKQTDVEKWGCDQENIDCFRDGDSSSKIWNFNHWFIYELLKKDELYNWLMSSRTKEDFKRNGQEWIEYHHEHPHFYHKSDKWNSIQQKKTEENKDKDFNYLKFLKEQVYTPLLIEKQDKYGIYNWIPEKVCHPERFETKKTVNDDVDKQLELLKQQQAILDRQIELEKLKDKNNSDRR